MTHQTRFDSSKQDIIIVGGGMVGGVLAHALKLDGWRVTVLEGAPEGASSSFDARLTALSDASWRYFDALGLIDEATARAAQAIEEVRVVDSGHFGMTRITKANNQGVALGQVIGNRAIGAAIERAEKGDQIDGMGTVQRLQPARYTHHNVTNDGVEVQFEYHGTAHTLQARLLIAADGAYSSVRAAIKKPVEKSEYGQTAIVCTAKPARPHHGTAFECFTRGGPLAVLPAPAGRVSLVWVNRDEDVHELMALESEAYAERLDELFRHRLGGFTELTPRQAYPLNLITLQDLVDERLVILGNAAHALHPVAGQGFNLCLRDVRDLTAALRADRGEPVDPGDPARLKHYAQERVDDYRRTIGLTDRLVRGFSLDLPGAGIVRGALLSLSDGIFPFKNRLVRLTRGI
ncbi:FAD-dependent monooxygenase [Halothiobacillus sp.]|uniref:FAD-dependent monooxygenase n=1 Tax=Halothiobacillus sp. TaxID=1891311 RepID=UPI003D151E1D